MKTFSFLTCKGLLKITAESREQAVDFFRVLAIRNRRNKRVLIAKAKLLKRLQTLNQNIAQPCLK